mmetsp:Transcript_13585/g.37424  ORF Transcript_13585/g.37424 Transcript_13585/m.37424 type:complete len:210 (-) Transcript_13585:546-1175(-)
MILHSTHRVFQLICEFVVDEGFDIRQYLSGVLRHEGLLAHFPQAVLEMVEHVQSPKDLRVQIIVAVDIYESIQSLAHELCRSTSLRQFQQSDCHLFDHGIERRDAAGHSRCQHRKGINLHTFIWRAFQHLMQDEIEVVADDLCSAHSVRSGKHDHCGRRPGDVERLFEHLPQLAELSVLPQCLGKDRLAHCDVRKTSQSLGDDLNDVNP